MFSFGSKNTEIYKKYNNLINIFLFFYKYYNVMPPNTTIPAKLFMPYNMFCRQSGRREFIVLPMIMQSNRIRGGQKLKLIEKS